LPTVSAFFGILIRMYFNDQPPPHFHALYNEDEAIVAIESLEILEGFLPKRAFGLVQEWAAMHRAELMSDWDRCRAKQQPVKIAPLE